MTYRMNAFWEWFYGTPAGYFSMEKSANMYIVHTKFIPQNCQCAQVYPVHRCRKIFRIQYRTWNLVNKINALHGHWSTHTLNLVKIWIVMRQNALKVSMFKIQRTKWFLVFQLNTIFILFEDVKIWSRVRVSRGPTL